MKNFVRLMLMSLLFGGFAFAQLSAPINSPVFRAFDANGQPLAGGKLYSYAAGTSTPLATYADASRATPNTNPVILDSTGQSKIFMGLSTYKFILKDANDVQQWSIDNVNGSAAFGAVTSVFGRVGPVTAQSGDYTCGQITGAVCSLPTLRYQTVGVNSVDQTQRSKLRFYNGTNITVSVADNSGANATDITITGATPPAVTGTFTDQTGSRIFGTTYQNTAGAVMHVSGYGTTSGSSTSNMSCRIGISSPSTVEYSSDVNATVSSGHAGFTCDVPDQWYYSVTASGAITGVGSWTELVFNH
jgi:hypothetical protein